MYLDIHKLLCGRKEEIKHKFIKRWKSFMTLSQYAEKADDVALINKLKVCDVYMCILRCPRGTGRQEIDFELLSCYKYSSCLS